MNISDEAVKAAERAALGRYLNKETVRLILEAGAPILLSHEREETRLAHLDAMVNRETKREQLAQAWEQGRVDGCHHRPNPYKEAGE